MKEFRVRSIFEYRLRTDIADLYREIFGESQKVETEVNEGNSGIDHCELELLAVWDADDRPVAVVGVQPGLRNRMLSIIKSDGNSHEHIGFLRVSAEKVQEYLQNNSDATLETLHDEMIDEIAEHFDLEPLEGLNQHWRFYDSRAN